MGNYTFGIIKSLRKLLTGPKFDLNGNLFKPIDSDKTYFASFFGFSENDVFTVDQSGFRFQNLDQNEIGNSLTPNLTLALILTLTLTLTRVPTPNR